MNAQQIAETIMQSARARSMPMGMLASQLGEPVQLVALAMSQVCSRATGRECRVPCDASMTFDQAIAQNVGRATAAYGVDAGSSTPVRTVYVMRPSVLAWAVDRVPHAQAASWPKYWRRAARSGMLARRDARREAGTPGPPPGTPGVYASSPDTQWTYTVASGDTPAGLAHAITGNGGLSGPGNYTELMDANPSKATTGTRGTWSYNFTHFVVGEKINIPKTWNKWITEAGQWGGTNGVQYPSNPGPVAPAPAPAPSGTYSSTLPAGRITALKLELGAWGKNTGSMTTYPGMFDVNDVVDESFRGAVAQFQQWSNATNGTGLRTDGSLDAATAAAIDAYATTAVKTPAAIPTGVSTIPTNIPWLPAVTTPPPIIPPGTVTIPPVFGAPAAAPQPVAASSSSSDSGSGAGVIAILAIGVLATQFLK